MKIEISRQQARNFIIQYQGLGRQRAGIDGILDYFGRVGTVQYDPLNVVGRNPDLVLQARVRDYRPGLLDRLLYSERKLVDGWDKQMSIYPVTDWPKFRRMRVKMEKSSRTWLEYRNSLGVLEFIPDVLNIIEAEGPRLSTAIDFGATGKGGWGHGRVAGAVLDYLFHRGDIGVACKKGTQKVYELIERLLPDELLNSPDPFNEQDDFYNWLMLRRIRSVGLCWNKNSPLWQGAGKDFEKSAARTGRFKSLLDNGSIEEVRINGSGRRFFIPADLNPSDTEEPPMRVSFIAPLDNLIWDRDFISELFDFDYRWEVYTPAKKRKYGYYVLPVLYGSKFIARFEPLVDREKNRLIIKNWWWEDRIEKSPQLSAKIETALRDFSAYLGTDTIRHFE